MTEEEEKPPTNTNENENDDDSSDDEDDDYPTWIQSIRSKTGLETAIEIDWPNSNGSDDTPTTKLHLSTCLEPTDIAPMFDGTQWAGTRVWRASIVATQYLLKQEQQQLLVGDDSKENSAISLLELGCGLGVPGMVLHSQKKWKVVLTDKDPLPKQLETNCKMNFGGGNDDDAVYGKSILSCELDWSRDGVQELMNQKVPTDFFGDGSTATSSGDGFDIVLNCDCVYEPLYGQSWKLLVETIDELLRINPKTFMLTSLERRKADGVDQFLDALDKSTNVSKVERISYNESDYPEVQLYRIFGIV